MNQEKWAQIKQIFADASALPKEAQAEFIKREAMGDVNVIEQVMLLLSTEDEQDHVLNLTGAVVSSATDIVKNEALLSIGDIVESFKVQDVIGEGGMGSVFLASRINGDFEQQVAIKVIHSRYISEQSIQRFRRERQILASLNHKNIASFIGGGETEKGQPYIILEYVDGLPINEYCIQHELSIKQRLALFKNVLEAVIFAHQNLVVHRDIKPNNVLVTASGEVKLLDFGIAKLLQEDTTKSKTKANLTQEYIRVMTPANASPEQILGDNVTTRSDVYGLGALLMYLLTDEAVFDTTRSSKRSIESMILETVPLRPSERCLNANNASLKRRAKILKGDLDNIVLKALQKDPDRRYSSSEQFLEDITRYQKNYPVLAKPDSFWYKSSKFLQRNTLTSSLTALFLLGIIVTSAVIFSQSLIIEQERDFALQQATTAQQTADFMTQIFNSADPNNRFGGDTSVREVLQKATNDLSELDSEPFIKAQLSATLAKVYNVLGENELVGELLENAEAYLQAYVEGDKTPANNTALRGLRYLVANEKGNMFIHTGQYAQAREVFLSSIAMLENDLALQAKDSEYNRYYVWAHYGLGTAYSYEGFDNESLLHYENALTRAQSMIANDEKFADDMRETLSARYFAYGHSLRRTGQIEKSRDILKQGIEVEASLERPPSLDLAYGFNQLASTSVMLGEYEQAENYALQGLAIRTDILSTNHIETLASMGMLSNIYARQKQYTKSIENRKNMLAAVEQILGTSHPHYAAVLGALGQLHILVDELDTAQAYYEDAYQRFIQLFPNGNGNVAVALTGLGDVALRSNQTEAALTYMQKAIDIYERDALPRNARAAKTFGLYTTALYKNQQISKAQKYEQTTLNILNELYNPEDQEYKALTRRIDEVKPAI